MTKQYYNIYRDTQSNGKIKQNEKIRIDLYNGLTLQEVEQELGCKLKLFQEGHTDALTGGETRTVNYVTTVATTKKSKTTTKIEYIVNKTEEHNCIDGWYAITYREAYLIITGKCKVEVEESMHNLMLHIENNSEYEFSRCQAPELLGNKWIYQEYILVENKQEFEEFKELYLNWKSNRR